MFKKIICLILFLNFQFAFSKTTMVAHKGSWKDHQYPQNTMVAMERALNDGFQGIELDVQITKDGQFILAHDDKLKRVTNCKGKVSQKMLQDLIKCKNVLHIVTDILDNLCTVWLIYAVDPIKCFKSVACSEL